jgi:hypothetical protein
MRRFLAGFVCLVTVLPACGDDGGGTASDSAGSTSNATTNSTTNATNNATDASAGSTSAATTESPTTSASATDGGSSGGGGSTGGGGASVMEEFGHPCTMDSDCTAILGPDGKCLKDILGVYALPGGYCSKLCMLPDANTAYVPNDATCGPGVYCIGADGYFEGCVIECTDNSQCPRAGYECRIMPQIGVDGDPKFCLMTEDNKI